MDNSILDLMIPRHGNDVIDHKLSESQCLAMISAAATKLTELFEILQIDHQNDHNTKDTPNRVAKMLIRETLSGRYTEPPHITDFENVGNFDQMIVTGPIKVRSTCAHHFMPIYGSAIIGIVPGAESRIIGLSKYDRIVDYFASRLQIQEELIKQIENYLIENTRPVGLAIRISAVHMCKTHRGVRASHSSKMTCTTFYGSIDQDAGRKAEFLNECAILERSANI